MDVFQWETVIYPKMHADVYAMGEEARRNGLPRECNITNSKYIHNNKILKVWQSAWYQGYDGYKIPEIFTKMEQSLQNMSFDSLEN